MKNKLETKTAGEIMTTVFPPIEYLVDGLLEQIEDFYKEHIDLGLVVIDTLQEVREGVESTYATDYKEMSALKALADKLDITIIVIHHTRKMPDSDPFNQITGSIGLSGCADGSFVLAETYRGSGIGTLACVGRDVGFLEIKVHFDSTQMRWIAEEDLSVSGSKNNVFLSAVYVFIRERLHFVGTPTLADPAPKLKERKVPKMSDREHRCAEKGQSVKMQLLFAITDCMKEAKSKKHFCWLMKERYGITVKWKDNHKHITNVMPSRYSFRDRRLLDEKFMKEAMENEFKIRARILNGEEQTAAAGGGAAGHLRTDHGAELAGADWSAAKSFRVAGYDEEDIVKNNDNGTDAEVFRSADRDSGAGAERRFPHRHCDRGDKDTVRDAGENEGRAGRERGKN